MTDLSDVIADFLQQNDSISNPSNQQKNTEVTVLTVDNKGGNFCNLSNPKKLNTQIVIQMLNKAAQVSGLSAEQLWSFLDDSDVDDLKQGLIDQDMLSAYGRSCARYPETVPVCNTYPFPAIEECKLIKCRYCQYFAMDKIGDGSGAGTCMIKAPASIKGLMWLNSEKFCNEYKSKQYN